MESDDKMFAILGVAIFTIFGIGIIASSCVGIERTKTERAAIERGCPTPDMSASSHDGESRHE